MVYIEVDQFGKAQLGIRNSTNYFKGKKMKSTSISFDLTNNVSAIVYRTEDNVKYKITKTGNPTDTSGYIDLYRVTNGNIKFALLNSNDQITGIMHRIDDDSSLEGAVKLTRFSFDIGGGNPVMFITGYYQGSNYYQSLFTNAYLDDETSLPTTSYVHHTIDINELSYNDKVQYADLVDTTSDLVSEAAAKYVSR